MPTSNRLPDAVDGDIVITPVASQFGIARLTAECETQMYLESQEDRIVALARASELAGQEHRVFLAHSKRQSSELIDCTEVARCAKVRASMQGIAVNQRRPA
jgi:hypothetical protein